MILRLKSTGEEVALLQKRLTRTGYPVDESHVYDRATEAAVIKLQQASGLVVDGIYGPKTLMALMGARQPKHLGHADLVAAAATLGVPLSTVRAVNEVESRGQGFLPDGRPAILYERHVMYRRLKALGIDPAPIAAKYPNLVNTVRGGYRGGAAEYTRLASAELIHAEAAKESASWGAFQVMGYHWQAMGYDSLADFVNRMETSEAEHLDSFVRFLLKVEPHLVAALKARKWSVFASGYNGKDYAANLYDVKLDRADKRYRDMESNSAPIEADQVAA